MKIKDIKEMNNGDLGKTLTALKEKLVAFRFNATGGKNKNVKEGKNLKRDIARILTISKKK